MNTEFLPDTRLTELMILTRETFMNKALTGEQLMQMIADMPDLTTKDKIFMAYYLSYVLASFEHMAGTSNA